MLLYLFFISGMYLALGFTLGWMKVRIPNSDCNYVTEQHEMPGDGIDSTSHSLESSNAIRTGEDGEIIYQVQELPSQWIEQLEQVEKCRSFVEATTQILTLEVGKYRDSLVDLDSRLRKWIKDQPENKSEINREGDAEKQENTEVSDSEDASIADSNNDALNINPENSDTILQIKQELLQLNQNWLDCQSEANHVLASKHDNIDSHEEFANQLQHVVTSQMAQVETSASNISQFSDDMSPLECAQRLTLELGVMLKLTHKLRDLILETMANILLSEDRLITSNQRALYDGWTSLRNRAGWDSLQKQWSSELENENKSISYALFDIDGFHKLNAQWGARPCDHLVASLGKCIDGLLRKRSSYDAVIRIAGQQFLVMLGDTKAKGATSAAERIRQTIGQQEFEHQYGKTKMTVTCAVTDLRPDDSDQSLLNRLAGCLDVGKEAKRNCTVLDEGAGPEIADAVQLDLQRLNARIDDFIQEDANVPSSQKGTS